MSKKLKDIVNYISEGSKLDQYISSKGIDPTRLSRASKIGHARSLEFQTWQKGHLMDSVNTPSKDDDIDTTAGEMDTPEFQKALENLKRNANWGKKPEKKKENVSEGSVPTHVAYIVNRENGKLVNGYLFNAKNQDHAEKLAKKRLNWLSSSPVNKEKLKIASVKEIDRSQDPNETSASALNSYASKLKNKTNYKVPKISSKKMSEDKFQDPKAATQTVGMEIENCGISKSAKLVKSIYKQKRSVQEDTYAHDAEKYTPSGKNKEPKQPPEDKTVYPDDSPKVRSIMSGGKTMTGKPRDDIEIDPEMVKPDLGQK